MKKNGNISQRLKLKNGEQEYKIGIWVGTQKRMLNKYRGKTKEEIEQDETLEPEEKRRVLTLLDLGISPTEERELTPEEIWNEKYNLLKGLKEAEGEYLGLTSKQVKKEQENIENNGSISQKLKLKDEEQEYNIGTWVTTQKQILNKYRGKTKEEIGQDEKIESEEKRRVLALLELGIQPTKLSKNDIGKAGFGTSEEECRKAEEDLAHRVEQIEKNKGGITQNG